MAVSQSGTPPQTPPIPRNKPVAAGWFCGMIPSKPTMSEQDRAQAKAARRKAAMDDKMAKELKKLQIRNAKLNLDLGVNNARISHLQTLAGITVVNEETTDRPRLKRRVSALG